jgi:hypothetical protein
MSQKTSEMEGVNAFDGLDGSVAEQRAALFRAVGCAKSLGLRRFRWWRRPREKINNHFVELIEVQVRLHMHQLFA